MKAELINQSLCSECGGDCCKKSGCDYIPSDFETLTTNALYAILEEGEISITSFLEFNQASNGKILVRPFLYLRARNQERPIVDLLSIKSPCSMLLETGCTYDASNRPSCGVNFIPKPKRQCYPDQDPYEMMKPWEGYQKVLERLVKRYTGLSVDAQLRGDISQLFADLYQENYHSVHPREIEDINEMVPILMQAFPEEYSKARPQSSPIVPYIKQKTNKI